MLKNKIVLIGAREQSRRVPYKNMLQIGEHPLIAYSIMTWKQLGEVFVSTDSDKIAQICDIYDAQTIFRPKDLAEDMSTDYDWIYHFLMEYHKTNEKYQEQIIFLRPTTPFRDIKVLFDAISKFDFLNNTSLRSIEPLPEAIEKSFRIKDNKLSSVFAMNMEDTNKPSQWFPTSYKGNGYIDILKPDYIIQYNRLYGDKIQAFITPRILEIDTIEDFEYAKFLATKCIEK